MGTSDGNENSKPVRGGARKGAGRPKLEIPKIRRNVTYFLTEEEWSVLEGEAAAQGYDKIGTYMNAQAVEKVKKIMRSKK